MMKNNILKFVFVMILATAFMACGPDDTSSQTLQDLAFEKLSGTWGLSGTNAIMVDGQDASLNYPGFGLSFTNGSFTTVNAGDLFSASGTWAWADQEARQITLDDGKLVTIVTLTETLFNFTFSFSGSGSVVNGEHGVEGNYNITLIK